MRELNLILLINMGRIIKNNGLECEAKNFQLYGSSFPLFKTTESTQATRDQHHFLFFSLIVKCTLITIVDKIFY